MLRDSASPSIVNLLTLPSSSPIGLQVRLQRPFEQVCCQGIAIIGSSSNMHAAALHCADCGRHRGWLPHNAFAAITEIVERFGRPREPITLKIPQAATEEENTAMAGAARYDDRNNRGALFENSKRETDRDPDYTGHLDVGGIAHWISGWINTSKAGAKYLALSVRPKDLTNDKPKIKRGTEAEADATFGIG